VRYEDVCENPRKVTRRIAAFVGIQPSAKLNQPTVAGIPAPANSFFARQTGAGRILKKNEHPHGEVLSLAKQQLLASCIGSMAGKLNYTLVKIGAWRKLVLIIKYRLL
jgi:hypothetical protein